MTERARCTHCGKAYAKRNLRQNPDGGAVCKDWFACQQRRDAAAETFGSASRRASRRVTSLRVTS